MSQFKLLGDKDDLTVGVNCRITREPWPFFDVKGGGIDLQDGVTISSGVHILTHSHQFGKKNWRELDEIRPKEPTVIGENAFIGVNAIILSSCKRIGKHSIIGAGSVVTKNVPDCEIWAGNPAEKVGDVT